MKNKRTFRAPVVMTLAAGAVAAAMSGCGGDVVPGLNPGCPSAPATVSTPCDPAVVTEICNYGTAFPACPGTFPDSRRCDPMTRQWISVTATCNPPPPMCPSDPPTQGAACVGVMSCSFDSCASHGVAFAQCMNGAWNVVRGSCNPPPPACPATAPADGAPCQSGFGIAVCPYGPPGCGTDSFVATCGGESTGRWIRHAARCNTEPACPTYEPGSNTFCTPDNGNNEYCVYGSTNPCDTRHRAYRCDDTGRYTPSISTCNPPPPFCPTEVPADGTMCNSQMSTRPCNWGDCGGRASAEATCVNNRWVTRIEPCEQDAGPPQDGGSEPGDGGSEPGDGGTEPGDAGAPDDAEIFVDAG